MLNYSLVASFAKLFSNTYAYLCASNQPRNVLVWPNFTINKINHRVTSHIHPLRTYFSQESVGNRVASSAISQSASQVARETKVRRKLVKERARLKRATVKNPQARIKVNRGDLPVIKLGNARVVLSRRRRRKKGQRSSLKGGGSVLVVGNRRIPGAFIQQLKNGRWHVMQRVAGKNRYPIDVVKIPMAVPLTTAFKQNIERIRRERLPKELGYALQHQLRMVIKR